MSSNDMDWLIGMLADKSTGLIHESYIKDPSINRQRLT